MTVESFQCIQWWQSWHSNSFLVSVQWCISCSSLGCNHVFQTLWDSCPIKMSSVDKVISLTHWGRVTHIRVSKLAIIGSDNGLLPGRHQAIIGSNAGILLIGPLGTNFSENVIEIYAFSFKKMHLKMSSGKWRPFCLSLNGLIDASFCGPNCSLSPCSLMPH